MARWRLKSAHYLNVPGTEYELNETSRETGKAVRKRFAVHAYLDPADPSDHNYPAQPSRGEEGSIIVTDKANKQYPRDIVFVGPPTMEMEPLDDEATAISAEWEKKWSQHPIDSLPNTMNMSQTGV